MHMLLYTSRYAGDMKNLPLDLNSILKQSQQNNATNHITGALVVDRGNFLQILEGQQADLDKLIAKLKADSRHAQFEIILYQSTNKRRFDHWKMEAYQLFDNAEVKRSEINRILQEFLSQQETDSVEIYKWFKSLILNSKRISIK